MRIRWPGSDGSCESGREVSFRLRHCQQSVVRLQHVKAHPDGVAGIIEVRWTGEPSVGGLTIERAEVVPHRSTIRTCLLQSLRDEACRVVRERRVSIRRSVELLPERRNKGARWG